MTEKKTIIRTKKQRIQELEKEMAIHHLALEEIYTNLDSIVTLLKAYKDTLIEHSTALGTALGTEHDDIPDLKGVPPPPNDEPKKKESVAGYA